MQKQIYQLIRENPAYAQLIQARSRLSWTLSAIILVLFYGLILVIAFNPKMTGQPIAEGSMVTLGVVIILALFVLFWGLTAWYVKRANGEFDGLTRQIVLQATQEAK
ncbi:putative membrane protein [Burkholderiales bacterium JOSHI_001]|nr:putative membrane protein [Burkholderiales bacterium JOSHI_001]